MNDPQAQASSLLGSVGGIPTQQADAPVPFGGYLAPSNLGPNGPETARMTSGYGSFRGYFEGDEYAMLASIPTEVLVQLQQQMLALGLTSSVVGGEYGDVGTLKGFRSLLALSNSKRERWQETITRLARSPEQGGLALGAQGKADQVYLPPDYDSLLFAAKDAIKDRLKRDASDTELAVLADKMLSTYRAQFDSSVAAMPQDTGTGQVIDGPEQVDAQTQFRKHFESRYAGEIASVERDEGYKQNQASTRTMLDSFGSLIGGGA